MLVRFKLFQLSGAAAVAVPLAASASGEPLSAAATAGVGLLVAGAGAASGALAFFSRRYVGELSLLGVPPRSLQLSTLDFWGRRLDTRVPLSALVPPLAPGGTPAALAVIAGSPFQHLDVTGDRQYIISLKYGTIVDRDALHALLRGDPPILQPMTTEQEGLR